MQISHLEKATDEEVAAADPKTVSKIVFDVAEVEGQDPYICRVECPWCGLRGRAICDTDYYKYWACGNCGRKGRA